MSEGTTIKTGGDADSSSGQRWFPLESNPILMNDYCQKLGFDTTQYEFVDVFSYEDWALDMIAQPVQAVVMLYPLTPKQLQYHDPPEHIQSSTTNTDIWFIKQRIGNACGTIGILHSLLNVSMHQPNVIGSDTWLSDFKTKTTVTAPTQIISPIERAELLENDTHISKLHDQATSSEHNATSRGTIDDDIITHFVTFIHQNDMIYELDGRKDGPIFHGITSPHTFLQDACGIIQQFMQRDPDDIRFTILALAPASTMMDG
jgi:ubiquitin carboxyl-terminal hydrolase L3